MEKVHINTLFFFFSILIRNFFLTICYFPDMQPGQASIFWYENYVTPSPSINIFPPHAECQYLLIMYPFSLYCSLFAHPVSYLFTFPFPRVFIFFPLSSQFPYFFLHPLPFSIFFPKKHQQYFSPPHGGGGPYFRKYRPLHAASLCCSHHLSKPIFCLDRSFQTSAIFISQHPATSQIWPDRSKIRCKHPSSN